jgi:hypothetical protein
MMKKTLTLVLLPLLSSTSFVLAMDEDSKGISRAAGLSGNMPAKGAHYAEVDGAIGFRDPLSATLPAKPGGAALDFDKQAAPAPAPASNSVPPPPSNSDPKSAPTPAPISAQTRTSNSDPAPAHTPAKARNETSSPDEKTTPNFTPTSAPRSAPTSAPTATPTPAPTRATPRRTDLPAREVAAREEAINALLSVFPRDTLSDLNITQLDAALFWWPANRIEACREALIANYDVFVPKGISSSPWRSLHFCDVVVTITAARPAELRNLVQITEECAEEGRKKLLKDLLDLFPGVPAHTRLKLPTVRTEEIEARKEVIAAYPAIFGPDAIPPGCSTVPGLPNGYKLEDAVRLLIGLSAEEIRKRAEIVVPHVAEIAHAVKTTSTAWNAMSYVVWEPVEQLRKIFRVYLRVEERISSLPAGENEARKKDAANWVKGYSHRWRNQTTEECKEALVDLLSLFPGIPPYYGRLDGLKTEELVARKEAITAYPGVFFTKARSEYVTERELEELSKTILTIIWLPAEEIRKRAEIIAPYVDKIFCELEADSRGWSPMMYVCYNSVEALKKCVREWGGEELAQKEQAEKKLTQLEREQKERHAAAKEVCERVLALGDVPPDQREKLRERIMKVLSSRPVEEIRKWEKVVVAHKLFSMPTHLAYEILGWPLRQLKSKLEAIAAHVVPLPEDFSDEACVSAIEYYICLPSASTIEGEGRQDKWNRKKAATALLKSLFPEGAPSELIDQVGRLSKKGIKARGDAIAAITERFLPKGMSRESRAEIVGRLFQLPVEEITARGEAIADWDSVLPLLGPIPELREEMKRELLPVLLALPAEEIKKRGEAIVAGAKRFFPQGMSHQSRVEITSQLLQLSDEEFRARASKEAKESYSDSLHS